MSKLKEFLKGIYVNIKQLAFLSNIYAAVSLLLGGRGMGKSATIAFRMYQRLSMMPGGHFFYATSTFDQLYNKILPDIKKIWAKIGLIEYTPETGGHYVINQKPPKSFVRPISPPEKFDNVIIFCNGSWFDLISLQRYNAVRGASYDGGDIDEVGLIPQEAFSQVFLPTMRGNLDVFGDCPLHHNISLYTSIPRKPIGYWIYNIEAKAEKSNNFCFIEGNAYDNLEILGEDWIDKQREAAIDIDDFEIEVLNKRDTKLKDGFYHAFSRQKHGYLTDNKGNILGSNQREINPNQAFNLDFDFGGNFNCMFISQSNNFEERYVNAMHVKTPHKINALLQLFTEEYKDHKHKHVMIHGEPRGMDNREDNYPLFVQVQNKLRALGWTSTIMVDKGLQPVSHKERYIFMNNILEGIPYLPLVTFNLENCNDALVAIERTRVKEDFGKDKTEEKKTKKFNQTHAPHFTDALDNGLTQRWFGDMGRRKGGGSGGTI